MGVLRDRVKIKIVLWNVKVEGEKSESRNECVEGESWKCKYICFSKKWE